MREAKGVLILFGVGVCQKTAVAKSIHPCADLKAVTLQAADQPLDTLGLIIDGALPCFDLSKAADHDAGDPRRAELPQIFGIIGIVSHSIQCNGCIKAVHTATSKCRCLHYNRRARKSQWF